MAYTPIPGGGGGGGGGGAPTNATYVTLSSDATLTNERILTAGTNVSIVDGGAGGALTISSSGGGGGAPTTSQYVTLATDATLTSERVLTAGTGITVTDAGAGSTVTIAAPAVAAQYVTLAASADLANERVLTAGTGITVTDAGAGSTVTIASTITSGAPVGASYLTLGTDATLTSERVLTAGTNVSFVDGGAGSTLTINASGGGGFTPGAAKRIPFGNAGVTALEDVADLTYDKTTHDLTLSVAESGGQVGFALANTSNTATSSARIYVEVAGATADDPFIQLGIGTAGATASYVLAIDNSQSDSLALMPGTAASPTAAFGLRMDTVGRTNFGTGNPSTPSGYVSSLQTVTSNGLNPVVAYASDTNTAGRSGYVGQTGSGTLIRALAAGSTTASTIYGLTHADLAYVDSSNRLALGTIAAHSTYLFANSTVGVELTSTSTIKLGVTGVATNATSGHVRFPTCAGVPTGVPDGGEGSAIVDSTTHKLMVYLNSVWVAQT
jgi:hypothetical protein